MTRTIFRFAILGALIFSAANSAFAKNPFEKADTIPNGGGLRFPLQDRRGDLFNSSSNNPFDLARPSSFQDSIAYDPETKRYYIFEKVGRTWFRTPGWMTFDEMQTYLSKKAEQ